MSSPFHIPTPTPTPMATLGAAIGFIARQAAQSSPASASTTAVPTGDFIATQHITIAGETNDHVTIPGKTIDIAIPTCVQTIVPDVNGYVPPGTCGALWRYYPSVSAAVASTVLFLVVTGLHTWLGVRYRKKFCWVIITAAFWETLAFLFRSISTRVQQNVGIYLCFQISILLTPLWINAFDYMLFGRLVHFFLPTGSLLSIPASTLAAMFVFLDIVAFAVQLVGGSWAGPTAPPEEQLKGVHIYMSGVGIQQAFIFLFVGLVVKFHLQMISLERATGCKQGWKSMTYALYATLGLITTRIVFRFVEFSAGFGDDNEILNKEWYFYVLEAAPMFLALVVFVVFHPGKVLVGPEAEMPAFWRTVKGMCVGRRKDGRGKLMKLEDLEGGDADDVGSYGSQLGRREMAST